MTPSQFENWQNSNREMTKEEYEFYEDFIVGVNQLNKNETMVHNDGFLAMNTNGEIGIVADFEFKKYLEARNKQKQTNYLREKRIALIREVLHKKG